MGAQRSSLQPRSQQQAAAPNPRLAASAAAEAAALPPEAAPASGYDAISESRKRIAAASAGRASLFGIG